MAVGNKPFSMMAAGARNPLMKGHILKPPEPTQSTDRVIFFDLDNTLYPKSSGVLDQFRRGVNRYIEEYLPPERVSELPDRFYVGTGLAIRGIQKYFPDAEADHFNEFVDGHIDLEAALEPAPEPLRGLLEDLRGARRWIFTNAGLKYALKALTILALLHFFEGIICVDYEAKDGLVAKPDADAYRSAMQHAGIEETHKCYFVDDSTLNVKGSQTVGWHTVHLDVSAEVGSAAPIDDEGQPSFAVITDLLHLRQLHPHLFEQ